MTACGTTAFASRLERLGEMDGLAGIAAKAYAVAGMVAPNEEGGGAYLDVPFADEVG